MREAESIFFNILSNGIDKEAVLSEESMAALGEQDPDALAQVEEQAGMMEEPAEEQVPVKSEDEKIDIRVPKNFFKLPIHPIEVIKVLKIKYNDEWVGWLPETLWATIRKDIGAINEVNQNKIQALATSLSTDAPWQDWNTFENVGQAFNDKIPVFGQIQPLSPAETAFTVTVLKKLHKFDFSPEVLGYIGAVCLYNGIVHAPTKWFGKAQRFIDQQAKNTAVKKDVKAAWQAVKDKDLTEVQLDEAKPVDVHVAKLWAIKEYLGEKSSQMNEA